VILHQGDADELAVNPQDRVRLSANGDSLVAVVETTDSVLEQGEIGVFPSIVERLQVGEGARLEVQPAERPDSVAHIRKKMRGEALTGRETRELVEDVVDGTLTDIELASWVTCLEIHDMTAEETRDLTEAMVETGETLDFEGEAVYDKHSIGGVPGNKITLLIVPIAAAAGLLIPKTSSRAVTGAAGTADVMEVFCDVNLDASEIKRITEEVGGVMCWGGAVNLAPADDIIIRVEHPLSLDPRSQLLASVMSKKKAVGADDVIIDIPMGPGTKVPDEDEARDLARDFIELGEGLDVDVEVAVTYGGQPVGHTVGPALEANEALEALRNEETASQSLVEKSVAVAGVLLEMGGVASQGNGEARARKILESGRAYDKFVEIVEAQGGDTPPDEVPVGEHKATIPASDEGFCAGVDNRAIVKIARAAGAPQTKGAGLVVHHKRGDKVEADHDLLTIHAEKEHRLEEAVALARKLEPVDVEGMLLERIPAYRTIEEP
jgi:AMP phosphorylase